MEYSKLIDSAMEKVLYTFPQHQAAFLTVGIAWSPLID